MAQPSAPDDSSSAPDDSPDYVARILKGSGSVFSGSIIGKAVGFILNLVLARGFGSTLFGLYSLGLTILRVAESVATLGLQNGIVRFGAPSYEGGDTARVKGTFLAGGGIGFVAGTVIGILLLWSSSWLANSLLNEPEMQQVIVVFACGLPFYVLTYLLSRMARAISKMQVDIFLDSILQPTLFLLFVGGILILGSSFKFALYAFLFSTVLASGGGIYALYRLFPPLLSSLSPDFRIWSLLRFSLPVVGVAMASIGLTYTDRIMLGILSEPKAVGLYQIGARLAEQLRFVLFAVTAAFSPVISDLYHRDQLQELSNLYANTVRWILLATLPMAILLIEFAPQIMSLWGPDFRQGAAVLRILAVAQIIATGVGCVGQMLQLSDHQDFVFALSTSMAFINVGLNYVFINLYGAAGAAIATGLIKIIGNVIETVGVYYFIGIHPFRWSLLSPIVAAILAALFAWGTFVILPPPFEGAVGIPVTLIVYAGALFTVGLTPTDRSIVESLWNRLRTW